MLKPVDAFMRKAVDGIVHRKNFVTGIITLDHGNKSYDVEIEESGKSRKKIFTLSPDPDLNVGDKARILYRGGNKEDMILLAPTKPVIVARYIYVYCWTAADSYCVKSYDANGTYINTFSVSELQDWNNVLAIDKNNNVYCVNYLLLKCYDKDGNLLYEAPSQYITSVCVGPDGYIYTYEAIDWYPFIVKRAPGSATIIETKGIPLAGQGLIMDSNKNIYTKKSNYGGTAKYNYPDSGDLELIASSDSINSYQKTLAIVDGVLAIGSRGWYEIKTAKLDLSAYINESLDIATMGKPIGIGNIGNDFILCGRNTAGDYAILGRYKSNGTKIWETNIGVCADTTVYQVAAYPF